MDTTKAVETIKEMDKKSIVMGVFALLEIGLLVTACVMFSGLVGSVDNTNNLTKTVMPITFTIGAIIIVHTVLWFLYFQYNPMAMNMYFLITGSMTMLFSITAISISLCQVR